ncbi:MAG: GGDEF domain-containing protein [Bacilli bacterium]|nr:GGDEF domain-containing protein [Bacilli bacterium]
MDISTLKAFEEIVSEDFTGVYIVDSDRRIRFWNKAAESITGYASEEMIGKTCPESGLNHTDASGTPLCHGFCPLLKTFVDGKTHSDVVLLQTKDGGRIAVRVRFIPIKKDGDVIAVAELFEREGKSDPLMEKALSQLAFASSHDFLTGLPSRSYIDSFLSSKLRLPINERQSFAVVFVDFDDFKVINDRFGHTVGDVVLTTMAQTISGDTRSADLMGRYGGEEFVGVYMVNSIVEAQGIAERLRKAIEEKVVSFEGQSIHVTASIGVTMAKDDDDENSIIRRADRLMYQSKRLGKNHVTSDDW